MKGGRGGSGDDEDGDSGGASSKPDSCSRQSRRLSARCVSVLNALSKHGSKGARLSSRPMLTAPWSNGLCSAMRERRMCGDAASAASVDTKGREISHWLSAQYVLPPFTSEDARPM